MSDNRDFEHYSPGADDDEEWVSKTQLKQEAQSLQKLGEQLCQLPAEKLQKIELGDQLRAAVEESRRIKPRSNAMKRHLGYIGKLVRQEDAEAIRHALDQFSAGTQAHTALFARLERWRDRLTHDGNPALQAYLSEYPDADIQHLRQLVRNASKAAKQETPDPAPARKLFKYLREIADV